MGGIGVIIRNDSRGFVAKITKTFEFVSSHIHIEALAAREGLLLAKHKGFQNFILETDSLQIFTTLNSASLDMSFIGHIVGDLKTLQAEVTEAFATHARCQSNEADHHLACYALSSSCDCSGPPDTIADILCSEGCN